MSNNTSITISRAADGSVNAREGTLGAGAPTDVQPLGDNVKVHTTPRVRVGGEQIRVAMGEAGDEPSVDVHTHQSYSSKDSLQEYRSENPGLLGTATNAAGRPVAIGPETDPSKTFIEHEGMRMRLDNALRMGLVARDSVAGGYYAKMEAEVMQPESAGPQYGAPAEMQQVVDRATQGLPEVAALHSITKLLTGDGLDANDARMFQTAGLTVEEGESRVNAAADAIGFGIAAHLGVQYTEAKKDMLVDAMLMADRKALQNGIRYAALGDYGPIVNLLQKVVTQGVQLDHEDGEAAGFETRATRDGKTLVNIPGVGFIDIRVAQRNGWL